MKRSHIELDGRPYVIRPQLYRQGRSQAMAAKTSTGDSQYSDSSHFDYYVQSDFSGGIGEVEDRTNGAWFIIGDARHSNTMTVSPSIQKAVEAEPTFTADDHLPLVGSVTFGGSSADYEQVGVKVAELGSKVQECVVYLRPLTPTEDIPLTFRIWEVDNVTGDKFSLIKTYESVLRSDAPQGYQNYSVRIAWHEVGYTAAPLNPIFVSIESSKPVTLGTTHPGDLADTKFEFHDGTRWLPAHPDTPLGGGSAAYAFDYMAGFWPRYDDSRGQWEGMLGEGGGLYFDSMSDTWEGNPPTPDYAPAGVTERAVCAVQDDDYTWIGYGQDHNMHRWDRRAVGQWLDLNVKADHLEFGGGFLWRVDGTKIYYIGADGDPSVPGDWTEIPTGLVIYDIRYHGNFLYFLTKQGMKYVGFGDYVMPSFNAPLKNDSKLYFWQNKLYISNNTDLLEWDNGTIRNISPVTMEGGLPRFADGTIELVFSTNFYLYCCIRAEKNYGKSGVYCWNGRGWCCIYLFGNHVGFHDARAYTSYSLRDEIPGVTRFFFITTEGYAHVNLHERSQIPFNDEENISPSSHPMWVELPWLYGGLKDFNKDWESVSAIYNMQERNPLAHWVTTVYYKTDSVDTWTVLGQHEFAGVEGIAEFRWEDLETRPNTERIKIAILHQPINGNEEEQQIPTLAVARVKYHAMTDNTWQWNLVVPLEENQQMLDGAKNPYNLDQMMAHLDRILLKEDRPFPYTDIGGPVYLVKVNSATASLERFDDELGRPTYAKVWSLSLLQLTPEEEDA